MNREKAKSSTRFYDDTHDGSSTISRKQAAESLHEISDKTPTLRDYFASNAMIGLFSNAGMEIEILTGERHHLMAELSYKMADAMLEARNK